MAFVIPNATDTTSGNKYVALDQSEPDALDFEVLGDRSTGVISGCEVTSISSSSSVQVSAGYVLVGGQMYPVSLAAAHSLATAPTNNRFDLVVARLSGGSITLVTVKGTDSTSNPTYPPSASRLTSVAGRDVTTYIDPTTDVVLAAVWRSGSTTVTTGHIVDKRVMIKSNIPYQSTGTPSSGLGATGDLYFKSTLSVTDSSGVYVKRSGAWTELAAVPIDPGVPVGTIIMWPVSAAPNTSVWAECDGSAVSRTGTYTTLFGVLGTTYGSGDGSTTFNLPDFRGHFLSGLPATGRALATRYGASGNSVTITESNLPSHTHSLSTGSISSADAHTHSISHDHAAATTNAGSSNHTHTFSGTTGNSTVVSSQGLETVAGTNNGFMTSAENPGTQSPNNHQPHNHSFSGTTSESGGNHTHNVTVPSFSGSSSSSGAHSHTLSGSTAATGAGSAISVEPSTYHIKFFIRYA